MPCDQRHAPGADLGDAAVSAPKTSPWPKTSPIGRRVVVPGQRITGEVMTYTGVYPDRVFNIQTPTDAWGNVAETECFPEGAVPAKPERPSQASPQLGGQKPMEIVYIGTYELAQLIAKDAAYAAAIAPRAVQILAKDYVALVDHHSGRGK